MEFVHYDGNKLNTVCVSCSFITINGIKHEVLNKPTTHQRCACSSKGANAEGKYITRENVVKFSKGELYLYDTVNNLLGVYKFSKNKQQEPSMSQEEGSFGIKMVSNHQEDFLPLMRFSLKKGCDILVFQKDDKIYIKCGMNPEIKTVKRYFLGEDTVYVTEDGCTLQVSERRNSKWNGIPIGRIAV